MTKAKETKIEPLTFTFGKGNTVVALFQCKKNWCIALAPKTGRKKYAVGETINTPETYISKDLVKLVFPSYEQALAIHQSMVNPVKIDKATADYYSLLAINYYRQQVDLEYQEEKKQAKIKKQIVMGRTPIVSGPVVKTKWVRKPHSRRKSTTQVTKKD